METVSTLDGFTPTGKRRDGNTTRLADKAIQLFFEGKHVLIRDHHLILTMSILRANEHLLNMVLRRLKIEHGIEPAIDKTNCSIVDSSLAVISRGRVFRKGII
jgi:hypothetical protein